MKILTTKNLKELQGKRIKWFAPAYKYNNDYTGECIITNVNLEERRPIKSETISGDNLDYAFIDDLMNNGSISYSDSYRNVTFEKIK